MKKTIACCLLLSSVPTWADPLELPRRLASLETALAEQWAEQPRRRSPSTPTPAAGAGKEKRTRKKLYLSAALVVGAGAVAYWSKARADAAYERYLSSASVVRQQRALDQAKRFDRVTGAALVGMEVGLVLTSYLLFFRSRS